MSLLFAATEIFVHAWILRICRHLYRETFTGTTSGMSGITGSGHFALTELKKAGSAETVKIE